MLRGIGEVSRSLDARLNPGLYVAYDPGLDCPVPPAPPPRAATRRPRDAR